MSNGNTHPRPTKSQKRDEAREKARVIREQQVRHNRRRRRLWQALSIAGSLAVLTAVVLGFQTWQQAQLNSSAGPANMLSDGFAVNAQGPVLTAPIPAAGSPTATPPDPSANAVNITVYYDYLCPYCGLFEATNAAYLDQIAHNGGTVEYHPIAILTNDSAGTRYSERAANAFACVANSEPTVALAFHNLLFHNQPEENSAGLDNAKLIALALDAGAHDQAGIRACIEGKQFTNWVRSATQRVLSGPIPNSNLAEIHRTPTVLVNGVKYSGTVSDPNEFKAFVIQATSESAAMITPPAQ